VSFPMQACAIRGVAQSRTCDDVVGAGEEQSGAEVEAIDEDQGQHDGQESAQVAHGAAQFAPDVLVPQIALQAPPRSVPFRLCHGCSAVLSSAVLWWVRLGCYQLVTRRREGGGGERDVAGGTEGGRQGKEAATSSRVRSDTHSSTLASIVHTVTHYQITNPPSSSTVTVVS
jgi:hypothetical protein